MRGLLDPPLDPSPDDARGALRRELIDPAYAEDDLVQRVLDWLGRLIDGGIDSARGVPSLAWFLLTLIVLLAIGALIALASRARGSVRERRATHAVLTDEVVSSAELRSRAERALAEGRHGEAVVDGYRALAVRQVERGRLDDAPGTTAHEVARALAVEFPEQREQVSAGADLFDQVLYGERPATADQARFVLGLDDALRSLR